MAVVPLRFTPTVVVLETNVVARPAWTGAFAAIATLGTVEFRCALIVTFWVVSSVKVPVAVNCWVAPTVTVEFAGVITIDTKVPVRTRDRGTSGHAKCAS